MSAYGGTTEDEITVGGLVKRRVRGSTLAGQKSARIFGASSGASGAERVREIELSAFRKLIV